MTTIEDVWVGRDGLLDEVYRLRQENNKLRQINGAMQDAIDKLTEGVSPLPERLHL